MMLDYLGEHDASALIEGTVRDLLTSRRIPTLDARSGLSTDETGDMIAAALEARATSPTTPVDVG
jgi:isocitrate/isopropylmalate dehydrogenase